MTTEITQEYVSERIKQIDSKDFLNLMPLLSDTTKEFLNICDKSDIKRSHVIIYTTFTNLILAQIEPKVGERLLSKFAKIPPKKRTSIRSPKTLKWMYTKLARLFYQPLSHSNLDDEEKYYFGHIPCFELMGHYVAKFFKETMSYTDNLDAIEDLVKRKRPFELTKGFLGCYFSYEDDYVISECLEKVIDNHLLETFTERLNEEITSSCGYLMKFAKKDNKLDDYIEELDMAQELLEETAENIVRERDQYSKLIQEYEQTIQSKQQILEKYKLQYSMLQMKNAHLKDNPLLKGLSVLVIGDTSRKLGYKKVVEDYGGEFEFIDGIEEGKHSRRMALKSDIVFHLTDYSKHIVSNKIRDLPHIVYVDRTGLDSLEQAILECESTLLKNYNQETGA